MMADGYAGGHNPTDMLMAACELVEFPKEETSPVSASSYSTVSRFLGGGLFIIGENYFWGRPKQGSRIHLLIKTKQPSMCHKLEVASVGKSYYFLPNLPSKKTSIFSGSDFNLRCLAR